MNMDNAICEKNEQCITRPMDVEDVPTTVRIHMASFANFFLTFLGPAFLKQLYTGTLNDPSGIAIVAEIDNKICGFVTGTATPSGFYSRLIKHRWWRFGMACVVPAILRPTVVPRLLRAFKKPNQTADKKRCGTLMSLAVAPEFQGKKVGKALVTAFLRESKNKGLHQVDLTTDRSDNEGVNRFYEELGFYCEQTYTTPEGRMMNIYVVDLKNTNRF
jgi:ribosomal protein S18 acetylase RimI-like enzyme